MWALETLWRVFIKIIGVKRGLYVSNTWTGFNSFSGEQVSKTSVCVVYTTGTTGTSVIFLREEIPSLESRGVLPPALRRSNPFWLVALRYSLFPIKSIIWVIFIINGRRLELSGPAVAKIFGHVG